MERDKDVWTPWPVSWSAIWVGALAALRRRIDHRTDRRRGRRTRGVAIRRLEEGASHRSRLRRRGRVLRVRGRRMGGRAGRRDPALGNRDAPRGDRVAPGRAAVDRSRRLWRHWASRRVVRSAGGRPGLGRRGSPCRSGNRAGNAQYGSRNRGRLADRPDGRGHRRLDGLGRAHDAHLLPASRPHDSSRGRQGLIPTDSINGKEIVMALILLWLLGAPLTLIVILFLLGIGR